MNAPVGGDPGARGQGPKRAGGTSRRRRGAQERPSRAGVCESCDREDGDLRRVVRVYLAPENGAAVRGESAELWCFSCRSLYPNEPASA